MIAFSKYVSKIIYLLQRKAETFATIARAGPDQILEVGTQTKSPPWTGGAQLVVPLPAKSSGALAGSWKGQQR